MAGRTPRRSSQEASTPGAAFNWSYQATATDRQPEPIQIARGRVMGGSGAVNGQVFLRGLPEDYDGWATQGNDQWAYRHILPFFRKLESDADVQDDFHGGDGPVPVVRAPATPGIPSSTLSFKPAPAWAILRIRT